MTWRIAARTDELGRTPLGVRVVGRALVLFRGRDGRPHALEDRCPHRGVPLSLGRCVRGTLACGYHGWRFDGAGKLLVVPSLAEGTPPAVAVPTYAAAERDGFVWVADAAEAPDAPPALGLAWRARRWRLFDRRAADVVRADLATADVLAPDRLKLGDTLIVLVPEDDETTRLELAGPAEVFVLPLASQAGGEVQARFEAWRAARGEGDWRLELPHQPG